MKSNAFFMVFVLRLFRAIKMVEVTGLEPTTSWSLRRNKAVASAAAFLAA